MGFYIRKSVSAGPFRFNLSRSGLGVSVGVKGFRIGSGPRGNYVHMGRGGLYYRASLGSPRRASDVRDLGSIPYPPTQSPLPGDPLAAVEIGNVLEMVPSNGSEIVRQINEKMGRVRLWPWVLGGGLASSVVLAGEPAGQPFALVLTLCTMALSALVAYLDVQRKTVVILYDLNEDIVSSLQRFANEFDRVASASRIWNIDSAARTSDWKRNAGAGRLIARKRATFGYSVPKVIKTNVELPSIVGGRQAVYFFPDVVLVTEGKNAGAISYDDLNVYWNTTVFIEDDGVPSDAQVVGYTWRFVNRDGGPDRRFNNNRRIPQVLYQQMGLQGTGSFQKILHISRVEDRGEFDTTLAGLRVLISCLERDASEIKDRPGDHLVKSEEASSPKLLVPPTQVNQPGSERPEQPANIRRGRALILPLLLMAVGTVFAVALTVGLYFRFSAPSAIGPTVSAGIAPSRTLVVPAVKRPPTSDSAAVPPTAPAVGPSFDCRVAHQPLAVTICADPTLSFTDLRYVQSYQALRQVSADDRKWGLRQEAISFLADVEARCGLSSQGRAPPFTEQLRTCISTAYDKQRSEWITRLPPVAVPEMSRQIDQHIALQRDLSEVGFLPTSAAIDGVYGPTTRAAIAAWQNARGHPTTAFLSDEEAKLLSDEAIAHRGRLLGGQPTSVTSPSSPDAYSQGSADWRDLKRWSDSQTDEEGTGVHYWEANRNVPGHASCAEMAGKRLVGGGDRSAFRVGCEEAKQRLDPIDDRRRTDPEYRAGFSHEAGIAPLKSTTALPPGTILPPPNNRP
jgi:Protein of unknown function (DUF4236)/Putative peptidoglycan binding domain